MNLGQAIAYAVRHRRSPRRRLVVGFAEAAVLQVVRAAYPNTVDAAWVAEQLGIPMQHSCSRLRKLAERGHIERRGTRSKYTYRLKQRSATP